jgi:hypothetical protein
MAATATILKLVSVDYLTNAWVDWSDFFWLIGVTGGRFLSMTSASAHSRWLTRQHILDLVSVDYLTNASVDWSDFFCGLLGVTGGRFLSMTSTAAHSSVEIYVVMSHCIRKTTFGGLFFYPTLNTK